MGVNVTNTVSVMNAVGIELGLDLSEFSAGFRRVDLQIASLQVAMLRFSTDVRQGFRESAAEIADVSSSAGEMGTALVTAARQGTDGLEKTAEAAGDVKDKLDGAHQSSESLGKSLGRGLGRLIRAGSSMALDGLRGAIDGVESELAELDELSQKNNPTDDDAARKQEILDKYGQDSLEKYRRGRQAIEGIDDTMERLAWRIMETLLPALEALSANVVRFGNWLEENEGAATAFFVALAVGLTAHAIPATLGFNAALLRLAATLLASPIAWVIGGLLAFGLLLYDLERYANNGEAVLAGLWEKLGPPEEAKERLNEFLTILTSTLGLLGILGKRTLESTIIEDLLGSYDDWVNNVTKDPQLDDAFNRMQEAKARGDTEAVKKIAEEELARQNKMREPPQGPPIWQRGPMAGGGAMMAISPAAMPGVVNNTDQSRHDTQVNVTVQDASPETVAAWHSNSEVSRAFANTSNSGVNP